MWPWKSLQPGVPQARFVFDFGPFLSAGFFAIVLTARFFTQTPASKDQILPFGARPRGRG